GVYFGCGPLPVREGERKERKRVDAEARRSLDNAPSSFSASAVTSGTWKAARGSPTAVAIGNDSNVQAGPGGTNLLGQHGGRRRRPRKQHPHNRQSNQGGAFCCVR